MTNQEPKTRCSEEVEKPKVGDRYFFVNTDFSYVHVPTPIIKKRTIYREVDGIFSTKESGDTYEVIRYRPFRSENMARENALQRLEDYRDYMNEEIDKVKNTLSQLNIQND